MKSDRERYLSMLLEGLAAGTPYDMAALRYGLMASQDAQPGDYDWRTLETAQYDEQKSKARAARIREAVSLTIVNAPLSGGRSLVDKLGCAGSTAAVNDVVSLIDAITEAVKSLKGTP